MSAFSSARNSWISTTNSRKQMIGKCYHAAIFERQRKKSRSYDIRF